MHHLVLAVLAVVCLIFFLPGLVVVIPLWVIAAILAEKNKTSPPGSKSAATDGGAEAGPTHLSTESREAIRKAEPPKSK